MKDTLLTVPSAFVVTTAVVLPPLMKFTVSYGFTKSFAVPFSCKFQPAFNTSPTVAALLGLMYLSPSLFVVFGAAASAFGAVVSFLAPSKLPATLANVAGVVVPSGLLTDVITSVPGTSWSLSPFPSRVVWYVITPFSPLIGYTFVPSAFVYATGVFALLADTWSSTLTVIVRTPSLVSPDTIAVPVPTNFTSLAFFTVAEYACSKSPVVLLEDTIQPMLRKSPTVAAVLSLTFGAAPSAGVDKSINPVLAGVVPSTGLPST